MIFFRSTLVAMLVIWLSSSCLATACIALKKFKVRQVCGQVQTVLDDVIPDAAVQVTKLGNPDIAVKVQSDNAGNFSIGRIDEGDYVIQADVCGFHTASQEFEIRRPIRQTQSCTHPLLVLMQVAAGCSSVAKTKKNNVKKFNAQTR